MHPAGLYILSAAEACERFGCYLLSPLALPLNEHYGFSQERDHQLVRLVLVGRLLHAAYRWLAGWTLARAPHLCPSGAITLGLGYSLLSMGTLTTLLAAIGVLHPGKWPV